MTPSSGSVRATPIQKRRVMPTNSGFAESADTLRGSSAIPQIGQLPGLSRTICGCMGHVYSIFVTAVVRDADSRPMPHFGHEPDFGCRTSGCIGHVYSPLLIAIGPVC